MWFWLFADSNTSGSGSDPDRPDRSEESAEHEQADAAAPDDAPDAASPPPMAAEASPAAAHPRSAADDDDDDRPPPPFEEDEPRVSATWVVLPWMTSLLLHVAVIVLGTVLVWSTMMIEEERTIIPSARLTDDPGGSLDSMDDFELEAAQDVREVESEEISDDDVVEELDMTTDSDLQLVGVSGGADGGALAPFGTTADGGGDMGVEFYGAGGNAMRIAYVIDASGSMIDTMPFVLEELTRSINDLSDEQEFTVIFYQRDGAREVPPEGWKYATSENKRAAADWISPERGNIVPRGPTNPRPALELAMRYRAELVFVLSDNITGSGRYEINRDQLLQSLRRANSGGRTAINTIQFIYPDPLNTLEQIAEDHGGQHRFITETDLGL